MNRALLVKRFVKGLHHLVRCSKERFYAILLLRLKNICAYFSLLDWWSCSASLLFFCLRMNTEGVVLPRRNQMALAQQDQQDIVTAHNAYRSDPAINTPPLQWSNDLAASAQIWADQLAATSTFAHSGTPGVGENIAEGSTGSFTPAQMVDFWGKTAMNGNSEQANFQPGTFPNTSITGNWADAGHYTQVIWRTTTSVGCGFASDGTTDYLVCQYSPPGNMEGVNVP